MRGRKPKPTQLKVLEGNPGKRRLNNAEPKPTPSAPACPDWLPLEAKAEWRRIVPELNKMGLLGKIDRGALATYCAAWARLVHAERMIAEHGHVIMVEDDRYTSSDGTEVTIKVQVTKNPALQIAKESSALIRQFCAEFGMTPSARSRMTIPEGDHEDGLESLLS